MKRITLALLTLIMCGATVSAAPATKSCVAVNKIVNQSNADEEFFRTMMERLQNAIVNTGKFDVVDNTRLYEIDTELKKQEDELTDDEVAVSLKLATISVHGTILSLVVESEDILMYNQKYSKTVGTFEMTIRFQDMRTGTISSSKQIKVNRVAQAQSNRVMRNTSKPRQITKVIDPEKIVKDPKTGEVTVIPAKTESITITPAEEKMYNELMQEAVDKIVENLMEFAYPLYVTGASKGRVYINLPEERSRGKMAAGTRFEIVQLGEALVNPDTGELDGAEEDRIMVVALQTIRPKFAIAVPVANAERFPELEAGMKQYRNELKAAKDKKAKAKIKPPFQARQMEGNVAGMPQPGAEQESSADDISNRFRR